MIDLTDKNIVAELLKRAVGEKGADYVYPNANEHGEGCVYFDVTTGAPSCIVGHVLYYSGVTADDMVVKNRYFVEDDPLEDQPEVENLNEYNPVSSLNSYGVIRTNAETFDMLRNAQNAQDNGETWGFALESAGVK